MEGQGYAGVSVSSPLFRESAPGRRPEWTLKAWPMLASASGLFSVNLTSVSCFCLWKVSAGILRAFLSKKPLGRWEDHILFSSEAQQVASRVWGHIDSSAGQSQHSL